ncbi:lipid-A-disaccharide synthase [Jannaschia sp. Os4]|uniref:lipid-A-disaccharide synthase n=1 Tax=Jannaschia sp. Os4 TaxID=2807617 RepID=UPI00193A8DD7|nr:lipid-A-disaccharide synthase [Jannaschia sp. Os4]
MKAVLVAGEPSGDRLGAALIDGLRRLSPDLDLSGVGGAAMAEAGMPSLFPMERLSVMGLTEVLPRLPELFRLRDRVVEHVVATEPDVLVTIDSPDFGLRVAARAAARAPATTRVHYVAPSVWAWRPERAERMARTVDHVLALLPFEPPYMERAGVASTFVGHPVATMPLSTRDGALAWRQEAGIEGRTVLVLPGSRRGEVARLAPVFGAALERLPDDVRIVVPTVAPVEDAVRAATRGWKGRPLVVSGDRAKRHAFAAADAALAASGTVSLELAANGVPMVIAYDMSWLTWQIVSRMVKVDTATLVNLVTGRNTVPEFLGPACRPGPIGEALNRLLVVPSERERQLAAMDACMEALGRGGEAPGLRAAHATLAAVEAKRSA